MRQHTLCHLVDNSLDDILRLHIDTSKLANAATGGLTKAFLGSDMAPKVEESKATRKETTLRNA